MTANIFGDRYAGRAPAWHRIAREIFSDDNLSLTDAFRRGGLDYGFQLAPLTATVKTLFGEQQVEIEGKRAVIRDATADDPEFRTLGIVSDTYGLIQNMELASTMDVLTETWGVETVGALGHGETVFFTLRTGDFEVRGDPVSGYFLGTNKSDGSQSLQLAFTPVRVVCQNTLNSGLAQARAKVAITHHQNVQADLDARVKMLASLQKTQKEMQGSFERMAAAVLSVPQIEHIFQAAYPDPKKGQFLDYMSGIDAEFIPTRLAEKNSDAVRDFERLVQRSAEMRSDVSLLFQKFNDEQPSLANTPWAAWNAVVEYADYRDGKGEPDVSTLWGERSREKARAMKVAVAFAK